MAGAAALYTAEHFKQCRVPEEKHADFLAAIEKHWAVMEKHAEWKIGQYRQHIQNSKR